jgi:hypothetical protein
MASIFYITQVHIEFGALQRLAEECQRIGITRPLIVTDAGIKAAGLLQQALDALKGVSVTVFDATPSNPTEAAVRQATALCQQHQCDGLIAFGGGSSIDCAKGVAIAATHAGPLTTYATIEGGSPRITDKVLPLIAIPTTAGTGSEVARGVYYRVKILLYFALSISFPGGVRLKIMSKRKRDSYATEILSTSLKSTGITINILVRGLKDGDFKAIMQLHAVFCMLLGTVALILPHRFYFGNGSYNHFAHEFIRLYGCLTIGIGYIVWATKSIRDARLMKALTETFSICYGLQALALFRAQLTSPEGHSTTHWFITLIFAFISLFYGVSRLSKKVTDLDLP